MDYANKWLFVCGMECPRIYLRLLNLNDFSPSGAVMDVETFCAIDRHSVSCHNSNREYKLFLPWNFSFASLTVGFVCIAWKVKRPFQWRETSNKHARLQLKMCENWKRRLTHFQDVFKSSNSQQLYKSVCFAPSLRERNNVDDILLSKLAGCEMRPFTFRPAALWFRMKESIINEKKNSRRNYDEKNTYGWSAFKLDDKCGMSRLWDHLTSTRCVLGLNCPCFFGSSKYCLVLISSFS